MSPETEQRTYTASTPTSSALQLPDQEVSAPAALNGILHIQPNGLHANQPIDDEQSKDPENQPPLLSTSPVPEPMQIERTPTPLPEFIVDTDAVFRLQTILRDKTDLLNIEQLEQLRAICLALVWKHRAEWNRASLVQELAETVGRYIEEVALDDMDSTFPTNGY